MPFGIAPPSRPQRPKAPPSGYQRRVPNSLGVAMPFEPPTSLFKQGSGYKYDSQWVLKNLAMSRLFTPPGGTGSSSVGVSGIGLAEDFGSKSFWTSGGLFIQMRGKDFFFNENGSPRNRNVVEATYSRADYADRFVAYNFRYAKRISSDDTAGEHYTRSLVRAFCAAALIDRPELLEDMFRTDTFTAWVRDILPGLSAGGFDRSLNEAYTYRSAAELVMAVRTHIFDYFNKAYPDETSPYYLSSGMIQSLNNVLPANRRLAKDFSLSQTRKSVLEKLGKIRGSFFSSAMIGKLVAAVRDRALTLVSVFSNEREWFAFESKQLYERRERGVKLTRAGRKEEGGGVIVEVPPLSLVAWWDNGDPDYRALFREYAPQWSFAGLFVARVRDYSTIEELWKGIVDNDYHEAASNCEDLITPNPFWTTHLYGMGTTTTPNLPNLGYADTTGAMDDLLRRRYKSLSELQSNESPPSKDPIALQKWVRDNLVSPDQFADPQYAGLHGLIREAWGAYDAPLMAGGIAYSDYDHRLIGKTYHGPYVSAPLAERPENIPLLRTDDLTLLAATLPSELTQGIEDGDLSLILKAQEWWRRHYVRQDDLAPVYLDPSNLIQTALIKLSFTSHRLPLKMTAPQPSKVWIQDPVTWQAVSKLGYMGMTLSGQAVTVSLEDMPQDVVELIKPLPLTTRQLQQGFAEIDPMDIAFGSMEDFVEYIKNRFGARRIEGKRASEFIRMKVKTDLASSSEYCTPRQVEDIAQRYGVPPLPPDPADHPFGSSTRAYDYVTVRLGVISDSESRGLVDRALDTLPMDERDEGNLTPRIIDTIGAAEGHSLLPVVIIGNRFANDESVLYDLGSEAYSAVFAAIPNVAAYQKSSYDLLRMVGAHFNSRIDEVTLTMVKRFVAKFPPGVETDMFPTPEDRENFLSELFGELSVLSGPDKGASLVGWIPMEITREEFKDMSDITRTDIIRFAQKHGLPMRTAFAENDPNRPFFTHSDAMGYVRAKYGKKQADKIIGAARKELNVTTADLTPFEIDEVAKEVYVPPKPLHPMVVLMKGYDGTLAAPDDAIANYGNGFASYLETVGITDLYGLSRTVMSRVITKVLGQSMYNITFEDLSEFLYSTPPESPEVENFQINSRGHTQELFISMLTSKSPGKTFSVSDMQDIELLMMSKRGKNFDTAAIGDVRVAFNAYIAGERPDSDDVPIKTIDATFAYITEVYGAPLSKTDLNAIRQLAVGTSGKFAVSPKQIRAAVEEFKRRQATPEPETGKDIAFGLAVKASDYIKSKLGVGHYGDITLIAEEMTGKMLASTLTPAEVDAAIAVWLQRQQAEEAGSDLDKPLGSYEAAEKYVKSVLADYGVEKSQENVTAVLVEAKYVTGKVSAAYLSRADLNMAVEKAKKDGALSGIDSRPVWPRWA